MSPIKGVTDRPRRLPRIGKIHLGVKIVPEGHPEKEHPKATDYFVFDPACPQYKELVAVFGKEPKELRILIPTEDEEKFAGQFYRLYSRTRGLVCKGDGETATRMVDKATGQLANRDSKEVDMIEYQCKGRDCPDYGPRACGEVMNLQFLLPEVSGFGVWQIDTGSINSIFNINNSLDLVRQVYGRVAMVPLVLALEPKEVTNPDDGKKKTVRVLNIRSLDKMIEAYRKAQLPPLQLVAGMVELPAAGDEPPYGDLPTVIEKEAGPGAESDQWPGRPDDYDSIPKIRAKDPYPAGKPGGRVVIKETGEILYYWQLDGNAFDWRSTPQPGTAPAAAATTKNDKATDKAPPAEQKPPAPAAKSAEAPAKSQPPAGGHPELWPEMQFADLITYVKNHKKTEGWLFKTFSFSVDTAKKKPYECALEVKQMAGW